MEKRRSHSSVDWVAIRDEIKQRLPIARLIETHANLTLKPAGRGGILTACCPFHQERSPSFFVDTNKGRYSCFGAGCDSHGDVFSFLSQFHGLTAREALELAAKEAGVDLGQRQTSALRLRPEQVRTAYEPRSATLMSVPETIRTPQPGETFRVWSQGKAEDGSDQGMRSYRPSIVHEYRDPDGVRKLIICRIDPPSGRKFFIPLRWGSLPANADPAATLLTIGSYRMGWLPMTVDQGQLRPFYGEERIRPWLAEPGPLSLLVVEGEKTADATRRLLASRPDILVLSPLGGGNSVRLCDWGRFAKELDAAQCKSLAVHIWPDADHPLIKRDGSCVNPQEIYARTLCEGLREAITRGAPTVKSLTLARIRLPDTLPKGWDLADGEAEGWTGARVLAALRNRSLPALEPTTPPAPPAPAPALVADPIHPAIEP
jgi:hypothetical protein